MSLVGSLEDLALGDILQIIHLSRKSGVLTLRSEQGEGHVLFDAGLICGAYLKDGPSELRELVARAELVAPSDLEAAWADARARGVALARVLLDRCLVAHDALERLRQHHVESAVIQMFRWGSGEFSFEVRKLEAASEELFIERGLNPQFLALEGTRQLDESARDDDDDDEGIIFDGEPCHDPELLAEASDDRAPDALVVGAVILPGDDGGDAAHARDHGIAQAELELESESEEDALPAVSGPPPPIVVIDRQLQALEWIKATLGGTYPRVHIFQTSDLAISRIRQYLARRELPVVLIAADAPADPMSGARDSGEIASRLRVQAPQMPVLILGERGKLAASDGVVLKPTATELADGREVQARQACAEALLEGVARVHPRVMSSSHPGDRAAEDDAVAQLREMSERLRQAATPGEVLPLIVGFAGRSFARVAIFTVIDGRAVAVAGQGLDRAGGPPDGRLTGLDFAVDDVAWFRSVLQSGTPVCSAPAGDGDRAVADALGAVPERAYVAPVESGGQVWALLYGDNLPSGDDLPDTKALEVLLHQAGLALDRVILERALEQSEA